MNDFLDRLATRALGGEGLLLPRLPSLFEPQGAPVMPPMGAIHGEPDRRDPVAVRIEAVPVAGERRPTPSFSVPGSTIAPAPTPASATSPPEPTRRPATAEPQAAAFPAVAREYPADEQPREPRPHRNVTETQPQVRPREVHVVSGNPIASSRPEPSPGSLLPPASPVFAARGGSPTRQWEPRSDAVRSRAGLADSGHGDASEPIIHVSIGRLEVRAAPAASAPSRRHDEPRPGSLDDYLRQRGKASP